MAVDSKEKNPFSILSKWVCVNRKLPSEVLQKRLLVSTDFLAERDSGPRDLFHIQVTSESSWKGPV